MKVLFLVNSDEGLYQFRNELVLELLKEHQVAISTPKGKYSEYFKKIGCDVIYTEFDRHGLNPVDELKIVFIYKRIIKETNPDIVFTYTIKPNVYGGMACAALNIPYVSNITGLGTAVENGGILQVISLLLYKYGLRKAQKVFFQNSANRDFMIRKSIICGAYDLLPGSGVNLARYSVIEYPNEEHINFLFIGRLMKEKGIDIYLDAAEVIHRKYPNTVFHICGTQEREYDMKRLKSFIESGIVSYHGEVEDISAMHRISSCTIHPTYYPEGLSNVLLESCACGRPIITTNRPGCREVVDDGINGYIVKEKDSQDLIEKIEMFLCNSYEERKQMGLAGRVKVEKEFNRQIVIDKYLAEIGRL